MPLDAAVKSLEFFEDFYDYQYVGGKLDLIGLDSFVFGGNEFLVVHTRSFAFF